MRLGNVAEAMENLDLSVLRTLLDWRLSGRRAVLATVVRTWGSAPRPVGSIMALSEDGQVVGSVSGGCIEDDLIHRFTPACLPEQSTCHDCHAIPHGPPQRVKYGVDADEAHRFGLPCGGTLDLVLEFDPDAAVLQALVQRLACGEMVQRVLSMADGSAQLHPAQAGDGLCLNEQSLRNTFGPEYRMLLIGAGQLTEYLATMAVFSGFAVTVCDPREEYRRAWSVPNVRLETGMPDDVVRAFMPDRHCCVIALTHDPKLDDLALLEALTSEAFYVGAIGSRRNNDARRERMKTHFDLNDETLSKLRGPIGLYIGSKTPPEIAVSVMAEILAVKNGVRLPHSMVVAAAKDHLVTKRHSLVELGSIVTDPAPPHDRSRLDGESCCPSLEPDPWGHFLGTGYA